MADTEQNNSIDAVATAPTGVKKRLPLIAAIVAGLAVGAGTGAVVVGPAAAKALGFGVEAPADSTVESEHGDADSLASAGSPPAVLTLDNLVLNPAASGGSRFLLLTVAMECGDAAALSKLQSRDAELRDVVLSTLSRKTVDELADVAQREGIKSELQTALNDRFGKKSVIRVYFPQYVVQ